jgi:signal transduction histidine kinase
MTDLPIGSVCYLDPRDDDAALDEFTDQERAILHEINRRVAAAESLPRLIDFVFEATRAIWPTNRLSVAFLEDGGRRLVSHHTQADYEPLLLKKGYAENLAGSSLQRVIANRQPRIINDLEAYAKEHPLSGSTQLILKEGLRSSMTIPLIVEDRAVGVLFRASKKVGAYDDRHLTMNRAIIERLSQAVEKAYRIEQLTEANRAYSEMLGFVSHELKSPVAAMVMHGKLLVDGYLGELSEHQKDHVERMVAKGEFLLSLVGEYLDMARLESGTLKANFRDDVDLVGDVIRPAMDVIDPLRQEHEMRVSEHGPTDPLHVQCDPMLLKIVMINLLGNAVKYGRPGGEIRVRVEEQDDRFQVSVWNEGPGFPRDQRNRLFKRFSRLNTPELKKPSGTGVGLYSCWQIVELHGGRINARSELGRWAEFFFHIPQPLPER